MNSPAITNLDGLGRRQNSTGTRRESENAPASAVSWGAIVAGAAAASALSLLMLILGVGLGLSSVSPWSQDGVSAATFGVSTIVWLSLTQLLSSGLGGYLAGRLRTRWSAVNADEVYFRDTAHGFLAWAVASLVSFVLLASASGAIVNSGVQAGATVAASLAPEAAQMTDAGADGRTTNYFAEYLLRRDTRTDTGVSEISLNAEGSSGLSDNQQSGAQAAVAPATEIARIFMNVRGAESLPAEDISYLGQIVAHRTGLSQQEAEKRVADTFARMQSKLNSVENATREAADKARKISAYTALWLFISLLIGAFVASLAATYGGRRRDL